MWCSQCNREFDGANICPECGTELTERPKLEWGRSDFGKVYSRWPKDENGEPEEPAFLTHCSGMDMDDQMVMTMLEAYGIVSIRRYPNYGEFGKLIIGMSGSGVDIYVPKSSLEDARALTEGADIENVEL